MDSSVVLPTAAGASNGFSHASQSAGFRPTLTPSVQSTLAVSLEADDPQSCPGDTNPSSTRVVSQSPVPMAQRHPADTTSTGGARAQLVRDRQRAAWNQMHERMEHRRREWDAQVDRMRTDFFKLKPPTSSTDDAAVVTADRSGCQQRVINVQPSWAPTTITRQQFQASFDLSEFAADEIKVQTDGRRLIVRARHEQTETSANKTLSREFTRQIDIPRYVDASRLRCTLTERGVLYVEADAVACLSSSSSSFPVISRSATDRPPQPTSPLTPPCAATSTLFTVPALILQPDGTCMFRASVSLGAEFEAHELTVKTIDRRLIVTAQRDETGPGRRAACHEFHHEFDLPESVDPETVTAHVTDDGQLVVEAPVPP